jgi:cobalt-zinc-cadmium efflux system membrane fusion protein
MKVYKMIFTFLISSLLLFSACTSEGGDNASAENTDMSSNEITVTTEQFSSSGMKLGEISQNSFSERIQVTGMMDVSPEYKAAVSVYFGGAVKNVKLLEGQSVKKGQVLFTLENPDYVQMQQDYLNAKSKLDYLKTEYERQKTLLKENVSSQKKYAKAESDYFTVLSDYEALSKKLQLLNINADKLDYNSITTYAVVRAPIGGYVTEVNITKGQYLSPNEVAVAIVNTEHMHLELNVFEKDIRKIKKGQTVRFVLPDNASKYYEGEVFLVGQAVYSEDRTINVHGHLKDESQESHFIPGMYIEGEILVDEIVRPSLPSDAVVNVEKDYFVLVKKSYSNNEYVFEKRQVKIGRINDGYTEILNAAEFKGDEIVIKGAFNLIQ